MNEKVWCIRDNGEWKNCEKGSKPSTLVSEVQKIYKEKNG